MEVIRVDKLDTNGPGSGTSMKLSKPGRSTGALACLPYALLASCMFLHLLKAVAAHRTARQCCGRAR